MSEIGALKLSRRDFLKLTGVTVTAALLSKYGVDVLTKKQITALTSELELVPNICSMCSTACDILVARKRIGDKYIALKIEGDPKSGYNRGKICARGQSGLRRQYSPNRIKTPLIRAGEKGTWSFEAKTWDEAWNYIKQKINELTGGDISKVALVGGWVGCVNYRPFMLAMLRRVNKNTNPPTPLDPVGIGWINGTPLQHCVFASGLGISMSVGTFNNHAEIIADYDNSDYILLVQANSSAAGVSVPRGTTLALARKKGTKIVVLDPRFTETAAIASEWIKIKPGTDPAFLLAMINVIIREKLYDEDFLKSHTNAPFLVYDTGDEVPELATDADGNYLVYDILSSSIVSIPKESNSNLKDTDNNEIIPALEAPSGLTYNGQSVKTVFQLLQDKVKNYTPEWASEICDVPAETIERIGLEFGKAARPTIDASWYGARYLNVFMLNKIKAILMTLKGMIDKEGGWIFTGLSRLPTIGWNSAGAPRAAPSLPGFLPVYNMLKLMAWPTPDQVPAMFPAMSDIPLHVMVEAGMIKVIIIAGSNPLASMYPKDRWINTLSKAFVITLDIQATETMLYSDVVLPETNYLERVEMVKPSESPSVELVTRFPAADPPEGAEPKHYLTITGYLLDIFDEVSGQGMKDLWFEKLKGIFGLSSDEASVFDEIVDRNDNEKLPENIQRFFAWLFGNRLGLCNKLLGKSSCTRDELIDAVLNALRNGPIEVIPKETALKAKNLPRNFQLPTLTGRVEIYSTILSEVYGIFKNKFGYSPAWDPVIEWPGVAWKDNVDPTWKPTSDDEFFVTTGKVPLMSFTSTTNNDLLLSLASMNPMYYWVWIPKSKALKLGINTGDLIEITNTRTNKTVQARAYVTDLIRDDTIFIPMNFKGEFKEQIYYSEFYEKYGPFVNITELMPDTLKELPNPISTSYRTNEYTVKIKKV